MIDQKSAARNLQTIRSLMERATVYRAISAPAALAGALLSFAAAAYIFWATQSRPSNIDGASFFLIWFVVLLLAAAINTLLLSRNAARRGEPFVSPGMKHALRALFPPLFVGGILGMNQALFWDEPDYCAISWIFGYGLALLATAGFAPVSIKRLGAAFLLVGTCLLFAWHLNESFHDHGSARTGALFMAGTFGFLHLVYGLAVGLRKSPTHDNETVAA